MLRTDQGGEFTSNEFMQYCNENGIARQLTAPYSPQQNRVVERRNRTMMSTTRYMMKATNMPQNFWAKAIRHAIHILNIVPTKALEDITPYEAIKHFRIENLDVTDEHHDQEIPPIEEDNEFPHNDDDDFYASPTKNSPIHS
nr:zinc finger, CCHC-type [Tanacetum cinerariifolium]